MCESSLGAVYFCVCAHETTFSHSVDANKVTTFNNGVQFCTDTRNTRIKLVVPALALNMQQSKQ